MIVVFTICSVWGWCRHCQRPARRSSRRSLRPVTRLNDRTDWVPVISAGLDGGYWLGRNVRVVDNLIPGVQVLTFCQYSVDVVGCVHYCYRVINAL